MLIALIAVLHWNLICRSSWDVQKEITVVCHSHMYCLLAWLASFWDTSWKEHDCQVIPVRYLTWCNFSWLEKWNVENWKTNAWLIRRTDVMLMVCMDFRKNMSNVWRVRSNVCSLYYRALTVDLSSGNCWISQLLANFRNISQWLLSLNFDLRDLGIIIRLHGGGIDSRYCPLRLSFVSTKYCGWVNHCEYQFDCRRKLTFELECFCICLWHVASFWKFIKIKLLRNADS